MKDSIFFRRESRRAYLDKKIDPEILGRISEIVRWSPSCSNNQPWRFVFVTDSAQQEKFMGALPRGNQWAAAAPVLIAVCARESDDYVREDDPVKYYQFDSGLAVMSLLLAATAEGLMAHAMAGYDAVKLHEALSIPDEFHVMCVIALGYRADPQALDDDTRKNETTERTRKRSADIITFDRFDFNTD